MMQENMIAAFCDASSNFGSSTRAGVVGLPVVHVVTQQNEVSL